MIRDDKNVYSIRQLVDLIKEHRGKDAEIVLKYANNNVKKHPYLSHDWSYSIESGWSVKANVDDVKRAYKLYLEEKEG